MLTTLIGLTLPCLVSICATTAKADEQLFSYSYISELLPKGEAEFAQWTTNQHGKKDKAFSQWDFRSEIEYGITSDLMTALYVNWNSISQDRAPGEDNEDGTEFKGMSSEWIYQLLHPEHYPVGLALYAEYSTDGDEQEVEGRILLSKRLNNWELAMNGIFEGASEDEDGQRAREAKLSFTGAAGYRLSSNWLAGVELRNLSAYPNGLDLKGQEYQTWSLGPCAHYEGHEWWINLTVLPQIWGNGDGANNGRQRVHQSSLETRLVFGFEL